MNQIYLCHERSKKYALTFIHSKLHQLSTDFQNSITAERLVVNAKNLTATLYTCLEICQLY